MRTQFAPFVTVSPVAQPQLLTRFPSINRLRIPERRFAVGVAGGSLHCGERRSGRQRLGDKCPPGVVRLTLDAGVLGGCAPDAVNVGAGDWSVLPTVAAFVDRRKYPRVATR